MQTYSHRKKQWKGNILNVWNPVTIRVDIRMVSRVKGLLRKCFFVVPGIIGYKSVGVRVCRVFRGLKSMGIKNWRGRFLLEEILGYTFEVLLYEELRISVSFYFNFPYCRFCNAALDLIWIGLV